MSFAILRLPCFRYHIAADYPCQVYWQVLTSEVGIILATAATIRSLFVARRDNRRRRTLAGPVLSVRCFVAPASGYLEERSIGEIIKG